MEQINIRNTDCNCAIDNLSMAFRMKVYMKFL